MGELEGAGRWSPSPRLNRALANLDHGAIIAVGRVQAIAEVQAAKIDGLAAVAGKAMQDVALLSQVESALAQAVPHASGRLATIADLAAVSLASVVADSASRIERC